jgi:phosphate acetyltransferase
VANWTTRRFDEIAIGDSASYSRTLAAADIELVAMLTGDRIGAEQTARPGAPSTHSIGASVLLATAVGTQLPGPGAKILEESLRFNGCVTVNDVLTAKITVREKRIKEHQLLLDAACTNQKGETVAEGSILAECPEQSYTVPRMAEVDVAFRRYNAFQSIFELCEGKAPVTTAVVHPCDRESLLGALEAAAKGLIVPILVGPDAKIVRATGRRRRQ